MLVILPYSISRFAPQNYLPLINLYAVERPEIGRCCNPLRIYVKTISGSHSRGVQRL
jgi:hypothetical protein